MSELRRSLERAGGQKPIEERSRNWRDDFLRDGPRS